MLYPQENECREVKRLDGIFRFKPDFDQCSITGHWEKGLEGFREIAVPASWNEQYEDLMDFFGYGWYERDIYIPQGWKDKLVWLQLGSVCTNCTIWLNGVYIGEHKGGSLPFEFDITPFVNFTEGNRLSILADGTLDPQGLPPASLEEGEGRAGYFNTKPAVTYDFFPYMGIHRSIFLYCTSHTYIQGIAVQTDLDHLPSTETDIRCGVNIACCSPAPNPAFPHASEGCSVCCPAPDAAGMHPGGPRYIMEVSLSLQSEVITVLRQPVENGYQEWPIHLSGSNLWGIRQPNLYQLTLRLMDEGGKELDCYRQQLGIRKVEVVDHNLLLNGKPIFLKGFGKHEDYSIVGKGYSPAVTVKDFELLDWVGANSFRTSHYPYTEEILDYADRHGILIIDETPFVGMNNRMYTEDVRERALGIIGELVGRDRNHPSVILWSLANEPNITTEEGEEFFRAMAETARKLDTSRPITYVAHLEPGNNRGMQYYDVVCINKYYGWYTLPGDLDRGTKELMECMDRYYQAYHKPVLLAEFGADAIAGMHYKPAQMFSEEYQEEMIRRQYEAAREKEYCIGTHVWAFADFKTAQSTTRAILNHKGVFTRDRQPKLAAHSLRKMWKQETE